MSELQLCGHFTFADTRSRSINKKLHFTFISKSGYCFASQTAACAHGHLNLQLHLQSQYLVFRLCDYMRWWFTEFIMLIKGRSWSAKRGCLQCDEDGKSGLHVLPLRPTSALTPALQTQFFCILNEQSFFIWNAYYTLNGFGSCAVK